MLFRNLEVLSNTKTSKSGCLSLCFFSKTQPGANHLLKENQGQLLCRKLILHHPGRANDPADVERSSTDEHRPSGEGKLRWQLTIATTVLRNRSPQSSVVYRFILTLQICRPVVVSAAFGCSGLGLSGSASGSGFLGLMSGCEPAP